MGRRLFVPLLVAVAVVSSASAAADPLQIRAHEVRSAIPSAEAYFADHGTYAGMTLAKLRRAYDRTLKNVGYAGMTLDALRQYDAGISGIRIAWSTKDRYCIESPSDAPTYHRLGPEEPTTPGPCPLAPSS